MEFVFFVIVFGMSYFVSILRTDREPVHHLTLTDHCVLCDVEVDLFEGRYVCSGCGFDSGAPRRPRIRRLIDVAMELRQAEHEAEVATQNAGFLEPTFPAFGAPPEPYHAAHAAHSEALRLLDHAARALPAFETDVDGNPVPIDVAPASDKVRDLLPAVRAARAAVRRLVLAG